MSLRDSFEPIAQRHTREYMRALNAFVREFLPLWIDHPEHVSSVVSPFLSELAETIARRMVLGVAQGNSRSWRAAAAKAMKGGAIYRALQTELHGPVGIAIEHMIRENAQLIKTLPLSLAERTTAFVGREEMKGRRAEDIAADLRLYLPGVAKSRIQLIARTEVGKAETACSKARAENVGLRWFEWATSKDQRVRPSHRKMDGVLVQWDDPPSPESLVGERNVGRYLPGCIYNCRCIALPMVSLAEVRWPHRVYFASRVQTMTRAEFSHRFFGGQQVAA